MMNGLDAYGMVGGEGGYEYGWIVSVDKKVVELEFWTCKEGCFVHGRVYVCGRGV
jgi:hypothetical protein